MTYELGNEIWDIFHVYRDKGLPRPDPRAFGLRLLEEATELALACGASVKDAHDSVEDAFRNEQMKDPTRDYDVGKVENVSEITGEIADVCLLAGCAAVVTGVTHRSIEIAARAKVDRLIDAAKNGTLHFTPDGRFYRRKPL